MTLILLDITIFIKLTTNENINFTPAARHLCASNLNVNEMPLSSFYHFQ